MGLLHSFAITVIITSLRETAKPMRQKFRSNLVGNLHLNLILFMASLRSAFSAEKQSLIEKIMFSSLLYKLYRLLLFIALNRNQINPLRQIRNINVADAGPLRSPLFVNYLTQLIGYSKHTFFVLRQLVAYGKHSVVWIRDNSQGLDLTCCSYGGGCGECITRSARQGA